MSLEKKIIESFFVRFSASEMFQSRDSWFDTILSKEIGRHGYYTLVIKLYLGYSHSINNLLTKYKVLTITIRYMHIISI